MSTVTKRKKKGKPQPMDLVVGSRLRLRRNMLGLTQAELADSVDLTFQQIQKYERGLNRVGAGKLWDFSQVLDVPISYFYIDSETGEEGLNDTEELAVEILNKRETGRVLRAYYAISDADARNDIVKFMNSIARSVNKTK